MTASLPALVRGAFHWNRLAPRGKSAVPRFIGRHLVRNRDVFIPTASGASLSVNLRNLDVSAEIYNQGGLWDPHVMATCGRILREGDVFYDIGSNTGIFAVAAAMAFRDNRVYAFEPQQDQAAAIRSTIAANGLNNVVCIDAMLGEADGESALYLTSHSVHASSIPRESKFTRVELPMRAIDSLAHGGMALPDVIKIDVEGGEMSVLRGAQATLSRSKPSIVFEADENLQRFGIEPNAIFETISSFGPYRFFEIRSDGALVPAPKFVNEANYLALAERHAGRIA